VEGELRRERLGVGNSPAAAAPEGRPSPRIFVDQCFSLEHNTGSVFNKLFDTSKLSLVLVAQSEDDYGRLLAHASDDVRKRWRLREWRRRREHDPIWLGVQVLDTYEELAGDGWSS
jgi:hypothetical protein